MSKDAWQWAADNYLPHAESPKRSIVAFVGAGIAATLVDAGLSAVDALKSKSEEQPLYIPDADEPLWNLANDLRVAKEFPTAEKFGHLYIRQCSERTNYTTFPKVLARLTDMAEDVYLHTVPIFPDRLPAALSTGIEGARWRDQMRERIVYSQHYDLAAVLQTLHEVTCQFLGSLPKMAQLEWDTFKQLIESDDEPSGLTIELNELLDLPAVVQGMILPFYKASHMQSGLYASIRDQLDANVCQASGLPFTDENRWGTKLVLPMQYKGRDVVEAYLRDTPLLQVFE